MEVVPDRQGGCPTFAMAADHSMNLAAATGMEMDWVRVLDSVSEPVRDSGRARDLSKATVLKATSIHYRRRPMPVQEERRVLGRRSYALNLVGVCRCV